MPYTALSNVATGDVLTATNFNNLIGNTLMGHPVYTTEAARDAAITSPSKGQMAFITASPTSATNATGDTTYIPTGILTIYNGSAWVCTTEVGGYTAVGGTYNSTTWGTTLTGTPGNNPSVTIQTGATALVMIAANLSASTTMTLGLDVAISGATTRAAGTTAGQALNWAKSSDAGLSQTVNNIFIVSGLTAGVNTFTLNYSTNNTGTITARRITVKGLL